MIGAAPPMLCTLALAAALGGCGASGGDTSVARAPAEPEADYDQWARTFREFEAQ